MKYSNDQQLAIGTYLNEIRKNLVRLFEKDYKDIKYCLFISNEPSDNEITFKIRLYSEDDNLAKLILDTLKISNLFGDIKHRKNSETHELSFSGDGHIKTIESSKVNIDKNSPIKVYDMGIVKNKGSANNTLIDFAYKKASNQNRRTKFEKEEEKDSKLIEKDFRSR